MERRAFLAIALSLVVLFAYQALMPKRTPSPATPSSSTAAPPAASGLVPTPVAPAPAPAGTAAATPAVADAVEADIRVETDNVVAVFTTRGARLKSWTLKKYKDGAGQPLELVAVDLAATHPLPFTLKAADDQTTAAINGGVYTVRGAPAGPLSAPATITFDYRSGEVAATKTFVVNPQSYTFTFNAQVSVGGVGQSVAVVWGPGLGDSDGLTGSYAVKPEALYSVGGDVSRVSASSLAKTPYYQQDFDYVGVDDHYFASFVLDPGAAAVSYEPLSIPVPGAKEGTVRELISYAITPPRADQSLTYYFGPKDFDEFASIDRNLTKAINFGFFSILVVPLLRSLQWIHSYVGNYGWAIVLLTLFINVVLFPLNHKSVVSMRKMQEVQPEAKAIQERYAKLKATDPARQKMNQELMSLYRERGVNPASGCIPILLTLPVFLAFYSMLGTAIELRGAPFIGWIHDLSMPDPWYVLPVLVGISQLVTQWMTPQAGMDPAQQKMMLIMPVVLIFVFFSTPAGALIYWFVSGVWRIGQMQLTNSLIGPPKVRAPKTGGRAKHVGQGKTNAAASRED